MKWWFGFAGAACKIMRHRGPWGDLTIILVLVLVNEVPIMALAMNVLGKNCWRHE
jgi:hypothetical protein